MNNARLAALRSTMAEQGLDRLLVTSRENVRYLSGFSGSSGWLAIGPEEQTLLTDFRYVEQAGQESPGYDLVIVKRGLHDGFRRLAADWTGTPAVGFEAAHLTVRDLEALEAQPGDADEAPAPKVRWVSTTKVVETLMLVKDPAEIESIARAADITDRIFAEIAEMTRAGVVERDLAAELEYRARKHGATAMSFEPIVASGPRAALPHAQPTDRKIESGDMVTFDIGVVVDGYASDMTRTVAVDHVTDRLREVYGIVLDAQLAGLDAVRPGAHCADVDRVARDHIDRHGFGDAFGHGLGHGVGLRIHEDPTLSWRGTATLEEGMVVTVEPGIYLPGWGGVRIEDLVVVTRDGCRVLSTSPKELRTVGG